MYIESVQKLDSLKSQFNAKDVKKKELVTFDIKCLNELEMKDLLEHIKRDKIRNRTDE